MSDHTLRNLTRRIQNLLQVGRTTTAPTDTGPVQTVQLKTSTAQTKDAVPVVYHYGFTAHIPLGSDVLVLNVSGDSTNGVVVGTGHQKSRPTGLTDGQVLLYTAGGDRILLTSGQGMTFTPSGGQPVTIDGDVVITGDATIGGKSFLQHKHLGVETGEGETGVPA